MTGAIEAVARAMVYEIWDPSDPSAVERAIHGDNSANLDFTELARAAILALLDHMRQETVSEGVASAFERAPDFYPTKWETAEEYERIGATNAFRVMLTAYRDEIAREAG